VLLRLSYDGAGFSGAADLPAPARTVVGELRAALARCGEVGAQVDVLSRTDAGVHARGQIAVVRGAVHLTPARAMAALASQVPDDLAVTGAWAGDVATARWKRYVYHLDLGPWPDPLARRYTWRPPHGVDRDALDRAVACCVGSFPGRAFARRGDERADADALAWRVTRADVSGEGAAVAVTVEGPAFFYRQVRSLVGAVVCVARGGASLGDLQAALGGAPGPVSVQQAPAWGLCLDHIELDGGASDARV
jgi:tRNA pseudouridine38-40 synthase